MVDMFDAILCAKTFKLLTVNLITSQEGRGGENTTKVMCIALWDTLSQCDLLYAAHFGHHAEAVWVVR